MKTCEYKMLRLNQFVSLKSQETSEQQRDKFVKKSSLNDFRNIDECNVSFQ